MKTIEAEPYGALGQANGVASLGASGKAPAANLPTRGATSVTFSQATEETEDIDGYFLSGSVVGRELQLTLTLQYSESSE